MKATRLVIIILGMLVCVNASAAKKVKKSKKAVVAEKVDTIPMSDFSYAFGIAQTNGLMNYLTQRMGVDTAYVNQFLSGFDDPTLDEDAKQMKAYIAGKEIRQQVESQIVPQVNKQINDSVDLLNKARFIEGFRAAIAGNATISADSAQAVASKQMEYYHKVQMEAKYGKNRTDGEAFLAANAKKDSVKTTESGLQYKVLVAGTGETPKATDKVKVNYEGTLIDGTVFDSSYKRNQPATFACNQVIKGWTEALTMMPVGSKWVIYVPQNLGYGEREAGKIPPFSTLIFTVELLEIVK
jgi:FKBP-type peptidyl-prolyl cis-trans isomerase FklB